MENSKQFHITTVFSAVTGRLMTPYHPKYIGNKNDNGFGEVYDILNFMTGDDLYTHQLGRSAKECAPYFPEFTKGWAQAAEGVADIAGDNHDMLVNGLQRLLKGLTILHGEWIEVQRIPMDDHDVIDPVTELAQMVPPEKIITFNLTEEEPPISPTGDINWKVED